MTVLESEMKIVEKKAKKYKKFLEKMEVNRNPVNINGKHYYEVIFTNLKGEVKGTAILSPYQEEESEAKEAHPILATYNGLVINIHEAASERARVSSIFFTEPLELMNQYEMPQLEDAKDKIECLYKLLEKHKNYFNNIMDEFRSANVISQEDVDHARKIAATMDLIHIKLLEIMTSDLYIFEKWKNEMKAAGLWSKLNKNVIEFYEEMLKGKQKNEALLATKNRPSAGDWEDQIEEVYHKSTKDIELKIARFRKDLRYPDPW